MQRARALSLQGAARARLNLTTEAAESYRASLALEPGDPQALAGLAEAAFALHLWDEARACLEPLHQRGLPPRVERALRLGELCERTGRPVEAIGYYQAALEAGASGADATRAWNALAALHHARGNYDAEATALLAASDDDRLSENDAARAGRLVAAAEILRKRLARVDEARDLYERALALDPLHLAALDALESIAESQSDWEACAQVLSRKVAATAKRPAQQKAILGRLAKLQAEKLGRPDAAREIYARTLALDPEFRPALTWLVAEARERGDIIEEAVRLERLVLLPADPMESDVRPSDLVRLGQLYAAGGRLDDAEQAARRALAAVPRHPKALALLDDILARGTKKSELAEVLGARVEVEHDPELSVELLARRASLLETLGRRGDAIAVYEQLTAAHPKSAAPWNRLAALLRDGGDWARLTEVLARSAERHASEGRKAEAEALLVEAAHLCHDRLAELGRSKAMLERALEIEPRSRMALSGLLALARERRDADEEDALMGRLVELEEDAGARAQGVADRARVRRERGDLDGAVKLLEDLDLAASPEAALKLRVEIAEARGTPEAATAALETLRERALEAKDLNAERWAVRRLARLAAARGASRAAEDIFRRAIELDPDDREVARALADVEKSRGDDLAYLNTLDQLLRTARRTFEGASRESQLSIEMAEVLRRIGDYDGAQARLREALDASPEDGRAWRMYGAVLLDAGAHPESARALRKAAELNALEPLGYVELAQIHEVLGDAQLAADAYAKAGEAAPMSARAEALERVGKDEEALGLWRQIGGREAQRRAASIARRRAARAFASGDHAAARQAALEALSGDPDDTEALGWALHGLGPGQALDVIDELASALDPKKGADLLRWAADRFDGKEARQALERAAAMHADPATLLALAQHEKGATAVSHFKRALTLDPACAEAAFGLAREGDPHDGARWLDEVHTRSNDRRIQAQLSAALGALRRDKLADAKGARDAYRRAAQESAPGEPWRAEALRSLAALELAGGDALAAEEALERLRAEGNASDGDVRHLAELYLERGAPDDALGLLKNLEGGSELLFRCLEETGQLAELAKQLELEAPRRMPDEGRMLLMRAADLHASALGKPDRAVELLERALPLGPSDADLWARLGALYFGPLGDTEKAALAWARALAADRTRVELLVPLGDYHAARNEWDPARDYYNEALQRHAVQEDDLGRVHLQLAEEARRRNDEATEEQQLQHAAQSGSRDAENSSWRRLVEIYRGRDDRERLLATLRLLAGRAHGDVRAAYLREALTVAAPEEAAQLDEQLLDADPTDREAQKRVFERLRLAPPQRLIEWIEKLRAAGTEPSVDGATQRVLLRAERRFPELLSAIDRALAVADSEDEEQRLELEAIDLLERDLGRPGDAARRLSRLLENAPEDRSLLLRARKLYASAKEPIYALALLDRELKLAAADELPQLKIARGELLLDAGADAEAEAEFLHALITTSRVGRAHASLAEVYKRRGDLAGALEHLIAAADAPDLEPPRAAACAVDAADVLLNEGDGRSAERLYQLAAALDPADRRAVDGLIRLASARSDHERHADLLGRAAALTADRRERARLALARARLFQVELKRELDAYRAYKEAVACDPTLRDAVRGLRALSESRGEWALAAELYYRELSATESDRERARLHVELARLLEEKLLEPAEALRNYEQSADLAESAGVPLEAPLVDIARLYSDTQRFSEAAQVEEKLAHLHLAPSHSLQRAEALARAGELYERAGEPDRARVRLKEAAAIGGEPGKRADEELLRLTAQAGDLDELKRRIEERLAIEPEGENRLELLRRVLHIAMQQNSFEDMNVRSQEVLARAPDDPLAFVARKRALEERGDDVGVVALLRARAHAVGDPRERASMRFEAGRLSERLYDVAAAAADYEAALVADPENVAALDALADLAYRTRHLSRARALYAQLADRPSSLSREEICRRRAELAEAAGDLDEAHKLYLAAVQANASDLQAHEALARLALSRGDDAAGFSSLKTVLDLLPLDAVDRITELRRQLGELAQRLGQREAARGYYELVLSHEPARKDVLEALAQLYLDLGAWEDAADAFERLSRLADEHAMRAELLYRRGEVLREGLGDLERANDAYLKAADLHPGHAPTLRRLVSYYYHEGDHGSLAEVVRDLEAVGAPLAEAAVHAGLGIALGGDEARGTVVVAVAQPTPTRLAEALAAARIREMAEIDAGLRVSTRALGGGEVGRATLGAALREQLRDCPDDLGARLALARLYDGAGDAVRARIHYSVLAFVDGAGHASVRLREMGPAGPLAVSEEDQVHPSASSSLRDALRALVPAILSARGFPPAQIDADPAPNWSERLRAIGATFGVPDLEAHVVVTLSDPAWVEMTKPPRLLLSRRALGDEGLARFATARALSAMRAGLSLVDGRDPEDTLALVRAGAALFLPDLRAKLANAGPNVHAWEAELAGLDLRPEALPEATREHLEAVLAACLVDSGAREAAASYSVSGRLSADRAALAATGDLRAGLAALCPSELATEEERAEALVENPAIVELLAFAMQLA